VPYSIGRFVLNILPARKILAKGKHPSLFYLAISDEGRSLKTMTTGVNVSKHFLLLLANRQNKLECLFLANIFSG
jgi:hypothetical protein